MLRKYLPLLGRFLLLHKVFHDFPDVSLILRETYFTGTFSSSSVCELSEKADKSTLYCVTGTQIKTWEQQSKSRAQLSENLNHSRNTFQNIFKPVLSDSPDIRGENNDKLLWKDERVEKVEQKKNGATDWTWRAPVVRINWQIKAAYYDTSF